MFNNLKNYTMLAYLGLFGILMAQPFILTSANDQVLDTGGIISETVLMDTTENTVTAPAVEPATSYQSESISAPKVTETYYSASSYISLGGRTVVVADSNNTAIDAGSSVMRYTPTNRFYYAHDNLGFVNLASLPVGSTFSITINGVTTNYRINSAVTISYAEAAEFMSPISKGYYKSYRGDISMMTCAGAYDANLGTSDHRYIAFADAI